MLSRESFQCVDTSTTSMSQRLPGYTVDSGSDTEDDYNDNSVSTSSNSDSESSNSDVELEDRTFADDTDNNNSDDDEAYSVDGISKERLYKDCPLSSDESAILVLQYGLSHKLTGTALVDLLALLKAHFPKNTGYFTYINQLKKFFNKCANVFIETTKYCNNCLTLVEENDTCMKCNEHIRETSKFLKLSIADQIQSFFDEPDFADLLSYRFDRVKPNDGSIEDVFDGALYQSLYKNSGILSQKFNISLKVNTDGVAIFKSSSYHLWPVYFQINELPPNKRTLSKYRILAGLWCGKKKPDMELMFKPIVSDLLILEETGHTFRLQDGSSIKSHVIALSGHFDTPAKDDFLHKIHHNGKHGCSFCEDQGKSAKSGKGHTHVYPYDTKTETGFGKARTCDSVRSNATNAITSGKIVCGIKKPCAFLQLKYFDVVQGISVDYMHSVCLGVVKRLLTIWFKAENKSSQAYVGDKIKEVDKRLLEMTPPNSVTRTPRSIEDHLKHYKASELKTWLLYYGPVCLRGILPDKFYDHFLYLSRGIYLLLSESITTEDLCESERCLQTFCFLTEELYGERYMTINFHLLLHTVESVRQLGPLWSSSCFSFEDYNGELGGYFHGTQHVHSQILSGIAFCQKLPYYTRRFQKNETAANLLKVLTTKQMVTLKEKLDSELYVLGATTQQKFSALPRAVKTALQDLLPVNGESPVKTFNRVFLHGSVFHSKSYTRVHKRNSYTVKYNSEEGYKYGQIQCFCKVGDGADTTVCALMQTFQVLGNVRNEHTMLHITSVQLEDNVIAVQIHNISRKCVFMDINGEIFISEVPNVFESD